MATRKTSTKPSAAKSSKEVSGGGSRSSSKSSSRAPVKKVPVGTITHSKTMANGQPRPKKRG